jgi:hypothetical protein
MGLKPNYKPPIGLKPNYKPPMGLKPNYKSPMGLKPNYKHFQARASKESVPRLSLPGNEGERENICVLSRQNSGVHL